MDLDGAVVVVTGATRGIGRDALFSFGRRGARVVGVGRSTRDEPHRFLSGSVEEVEDGLDEQGINALMVRADLNDPADVHRIADQTLEWAGRCDVLINNAAYTTTGPILDVSPTRWLLAFRLAVFAPLQLCQHFVPGMQERGQGRIVSISSSASQQYLPTLALYSASKQAMEHWSDLMHAELGGHGVTFNTMRIDEPVPTEAWRLISDRSNLREEQLAESGGSEERMVSPTQCAEAITWMASQPDDWSGNTVTFADLRRLGGLPESSRSPSGS